MMRVVAPRVGAWIETLSFSAAFGSVATSRPAWARGLKQIIEHYAMAGWSRAPRGRVD